MEEPPALKALRVAHPAIDLAYEALWRKSFDHHPHEEGLLIYQSNTTGNLLIDAWTLVPVLNPATKRYDRLGFRDPTMTEFPEYDGWTLIASVHTHPWPTADRGSLWCFVLTCEGDRGPSSPKPDMQTSRKYPQLFHVILGLHVVWGRETYYYGDTADIE